MTGKTNAPAFDFYPERFWFAVEGWPDTEIVRYMRLLSQQWMRGGLPDSMVELRALARGHLSERLLSKFPLWEDGQRRNRFMEEVRNKQRDRLDASSFRQTVVAWKRWHQGEELPPHLRSLEAYKEHLATDATALPRHSHGSATGMPGGGMPRVSPPTSHIPHPTSHVVTEKQAIEKKTHRQGGDGVARPPLEVVVAYAITLGLSEGAGRKWWQEQEGKGWLHNGQPIRIWRSMIGSYAEAVHRKARAKVPLWQIEKEEKQLRADLEDVASYQSGQWGTLPKKQQQRKKEIAARLHELKQMRAERNK